MEYNWAYFILSEFSVRKLLKIMNFCINILFLYSHVHSSYHCLFFNFIIIIVTLYSAGSEYKCTIKMS